MMAHGMAQQKRNGEMDKQVGDGESTDSYWMGLAEDNRRLRSAIDDARKRLAKGRALWNGPCHECDAVLSAALAPEGPRANLRTPWATPK